MIPEDRLPDDDNPSPNFKIPIWRTVAVIIPFVAVVSILWVRHRQAAIASDLSHKEDNSSGIRMGGYRAVLTLADGRRLDLEQEPKGNIASQYGAKIIMTDSAVSYIPDPIHGPESPQQTPAQYNILTTPRTSQFAIVLSDGTRVWLNDSTSLYYPTFFNGPYREVMLSGEAFFEVAKDPARPFRVRAGSLTVNVLGTSFSLRAYGDENNSTAILLNGRISVKDGRREEFLHPNESVCISRQNQWLVRKDIEPDSVLAWKEGVFYFSHADIVTVMRELARWYNVEVVMKVPNNQYSYEGEFSRYASLPVILNYMTNKDVHFIREGNKVIVTP
jgi:hypothetical protein